MIICYLCRLAQEDIEPMVVCVWSAYLLLSCMTGFIWDLWHLYLLLFTGSLLTSSLREREEKVKYKSHASVSIDLFFQRTSRIQKCYFYYLLDIMHLWIPIPRGGGDREDWMSFWSQLFKSWIVLSSGDTGKSLSTG